MGEQDPYVMQIIQDLPENGHFLEVGVLFANMPRLEALKERNIHFWGMDTLDICNRIWVSLPAQYHDQVTLIGNEKQDYNWSLMMLIKSLQDRSGSTSHFDAVYLDGHHTLFVDGLAMYLCSSLVKEGGYLLMDDYYWTLNQQETNIKSDGHYIGQYDFEKYNEEQRACSHLGLIIDYLLPESGKFIPVIDNFAWKKTG
jgi:hypothetical protein